MTSYEDIIVDRDDAILTITINREQSANRFRPQTCLEMSDTLQRFRLDPGLRVAILTGAGTRSSASAASTRKPRAWITASVMPIVDVYQAIDTIPKPIIAAVNGFAVGGGNVLQIVCDLTIASETAVFRQVGPLVGSFDAGYGTWYLEDSIGRKRAKEMWYLNRKYTAQEAFARGMVNDVVPAADLMAHARSVAREITTRSPLAIAALKTAFSARTTACLDRRGWPTISTSLPT